MIKPYQTLAMLGPTFCVWPLCFGQGNAKGLVEDWAHGSAPGQRDEKLKCKPAKIPGLDAVDSVDQLLRHEDSPT